MKSFQRNGVGTETKKMLPEQSRARRRLFEADPLEEAIVDNVSNILQELRTIDRNHMIKKYNFDTEHDVALEGRYEWLRWGGHSWEKMEPVAETVIEDKFVPIEKENQMTPKVSTAEAPPVVRKRMRDGTLLTDRMTKRKISF